MFFNGALPKCITIKCSHVLLYDCFSSAQDLIDPAQFAWITPLLGDISEECRNASEQYRDDLIATLQYGSLTEAITMFDSNGRLPMEGFLSDYIEIPIDLCADTDECFLPVALSTITLKLPIGFSNHPGHFEGCLGVKEIETKYCAVSLRTPSSMSAFPFKQTPAYQTPSLKNIARLLDEYTSIKRLLNHNNVFPLVDVLDPESISKYKTSLSNSKITEEEIDKLIDKILLFFMALYATLSSPSIGMCFPQSCTTSDINENYQVLTELAYEDVIITINGNPFPVSLNANLSIMADDYFCYTNDDRSKMPEKLPGLNIFFYVIYIVIAVLILSGTAYDIFLVKSATQKKTKNFSEKFVLCFSAYTNGKHLMSTKSVGTDHLDCLNGIRFISMTWVVLGHSFLSAFNARNIGAALELFTGGGGFAFEAIVNALPSVDTFFLMAATLTTYILLKELEKAGSDLSKHTITFIMYYVHRYLRITMPYVLIMGVVIAVLPYLYSGPGWVAIAYESDQCSSMGWANLLYVQTLLNSTMNSACMGVTWYLVDDMIFHWFSPIIVYPMFIFFWRTKKHVLGLSWWFFSMTCFTAGVFYIAYSTRLPPVEGLQFPTLETDYTYKVEFYYVPWARYQAYLIGILLGYILHHTRGKAVKINEVVNIIMWQVAFLSAFAVVYGLYDARVTSEISLFSATMYNTFQRIAWNCSVAWVIFSCVKGYGGIVNDFLSWSFFAPLARLTFCAYLIHMNLIQMFDNSVIKSFPYDFSMWTSVWFFLGSMMITLAVAFGLALVFESPSVRVEKLIITTLLQPILQNQSQHKKPEFPKQEHQANGNGEGLKYQEKKEHEEHIKTDIKGDNGV